MNQAQVSKRYQRELFLSMVAYAAVLVASITILKKLDVPQELKIVITLLPALPVAFVLVSMLRVIRDSDELQQRVYLLATSFSALLTGLITFTYGFLENIGFPKFSTFLVLPMLFFFWGISLSWFSKKYQ